LNLLLELAERTGVGGLVLLEELEHLLDALRGQLVADVVQVFGLALPEEELNRGIRVLAALQSRLGVLLKDILDLSGPVRDGLLQKVTLILGGRLLGGGYIVGRQWKLGSAIDVTDGDVGVGQENVELVHQILGDELGHVHHVVRVAENGQVNIVTDEVKIGKNIFVELHENNLFVDIFVVDVQLLTFGAGSDTKAQEGLLLDLLRAGGSVQENNLVRLLSDGEQVHLVSGGIEEALQRVLIDFVAFHRGDLILGHTLHPQVDNGLLEHVVFRFQIWNLLCK
jgi:hypothetical protein